MARRARPTYRHVPPARPTMPTAPTATIGVYQGRPAPRPATASGSRTGDKGQATWRVPMSYRTPTTHDARWSRTASQ